MLSVIIATDQSERVLVPTLSALVPGATAGIVREVIIADAGSRDETGKIADIAGCRFMVNEGPLGARLARRRRNGARTVAPVPAARALSSKRPGPTRSAASFSRPNSRRRERGRVPAGRCQRANAARGCSRHSRCSPVDCADGRSPIKACWSPSGATRTSAAIPPPPPSRRPISCAVSDAPSRRWIAARC